MKSANALPGKLGLLGPAGKLLDAGALSAETLAAQRGNEPSTSVY